jgi:pilus assembly protein CpaB
MKQQRTLIVMAVAVVTAGIAAFAVYQAIQRMPVQQVQVDSVPVVVAAKVLTVGTQLTTDDVRIVTWPAKSQVPGSFADPKDVINRGVTATIGENQPLTNLNVAGPGQGHGLPPVIPPGMRAMAVRTSDVIAVAGWTVPGTRVDVLVAVKDDGVENNGRDTPMARTVVSNVLVLSTGVNINQDEARKGENIQATVVTLAVLPEDGERITLAETEGKIKFALRNPVDVDATQTQGIKFPQLMRGPGPEPVVVDAVQRRVAPKRITPAPTVVVAPPPPTPQPRTIKVIRAAKETEEVLD